MKSAARWRGAELSRIFSGVNHRKICIFFHKKNPFGFSCTKKDRATCMSGAQHPLNPDVPASTRVLTYLHGHVDQGTVERLHLWTLGQNKRNLMKKKTNSVQCHWINNDNTKNNAIGIVPPERLHKPGMRVQWSPSTLTAQIKWSDPSSELLLRDKVAILNRKINKNKNKMMEKWWKNDGKMVEKWTREEI